MPHLTSDHDVFPVRCVIKTVVNIKVSLVVVFPIGLCLACTQLGSPASRHKINLTETVQPISSATVVRPNCAELSRQRCSSAQLQEQRGSQSSLQGQLLLGR